MFLGCLKLNIFIAYSRSLKDKRQVTKSIKQRARNAFNVSVAEEPSDKWQTSEMLFVCADYIKNRLNDTLDRIEEFVRVSNDIQIVGRNKEIL